MKIDKPLNIIFVRELTNKTFRGYVIKEHPDGFNFAHEITLENELKEELSAESDIYLKEKELEDFNFQVGLLIDKSNSFINYNKTT